jgi:hypothetical protein
LAEHVRGRRRCQARQNFAFEEAGRVDVRRVAEVAVEEQVGRGVGGSAGGAKVVVSTPTGLTESGRSGRKRCSRAASSGDMTAT